MTSMRFLFLLVAAATLASAGMMVSARKMMHSALWFVLALLGVAALFAMLESSFFAVVQVVVYIGAISILIIFAVMLTRQVMEDKTPQVNPNWRLAVLLAAGLFAGLVGGLSSWNGFNSALAALPAQGENLAAFGRNLVDPTGFALVFELASVLLIAAMIGAITIAAETKPGRKK
jgi:NADH-quinone oxidoreductase subunit J